MPGVESEVYISGNFTVLSPEEADKQEPKYRKNAAENGARSVKTRYVYLVAKSDLQYGGRTTC
jgi:hypothetical protein